MFIFKFALIEEKKEKKKERKKEKRNKIEKEKGAGHRKMIVCKSDPTCKRMNESHHC